MRKQHRLGLQLAPWVVVTIVLGVLAPWMWLPLAVCAVWIVAALWALWHAPHDGLRQ